MKQFFAVAFLAFVSLVQAQRQCMAAAEAVPACGAAYLRSAAHSIGNCGIVDFRCQCSNSAAVQSAVAQTVLSQCGQNAGQLLQSVSAECDCVSKHPKATITPNAVAKACSTRAFNVPPCGAGYLSSAAYSIAGCGLQDFACQCSNSAAIQSAAQNAVLSQCGPSAVDVLQSQSRLCECVTKRGKEGPITSA